MLTLTALLALAVTLDPAAPPTDAAGATAVVEAQAVSDASEPCLLAADLDAAPEGLDAATSAVPICILTYCRELGLRCDFTSVHPTRNCCQYSCYEDHSCTTKQDPPNVCKKKGWPL